VDSAKPVPSTPTNFKGVLADDNTVKLSWNLVSGASGYQLSRATSKTGTFKSIKTTGATSYLDTGVTGGRTYYYKVRAYKYVGTTKIYGKFTVIIPVNTTKVVGYYAAWAAYSGYTPDNVDVSKLTHINYAFANVGSDLKIKLGYPDVDISNFNKLKELKKSYPKLKTIISVGGWSWSDRFSDVALTDASRTTFANSCVDFIVQNGFDGVDIDWEYPVYGGMSINKNRPEDKTNFTLLMQKLREKLNQREVIDKKHYILTFAGGSSNSYLNNIETNKLSRYVNYVNIMTYDIHGTWDSYTDLTAPLYPNDDTAPQYKWSIDQSINAWLTAGLPKDKMVIGVPFYGYVYKGVSNTMDGLYQSYSGGSSISYENIVNNYLNKPEYIRHFHDESKVPWLFNGSTFISYEDEQSIGLKAKYIKSKGLGGGMIWELSQDPSNVLLESFYTGLK
jgi:chitinase